MPVTGESWFTATQAALNLVIDSLKASGLWWLKRSSTSRPEPIKRPRKGDKTAAAKLIWKGTEPAPKALVATYLESREIRIPIPATIRYHRALCHPSGSTYPAMVSLVTDVNDLPVAIHRTWLARDGTGKASVANNKMMLGPCGGGAVRLAPAVGPLMVGEGLETCLSVMQERHFPAWAALSTSGLRSLELPSGAHDIIVLADADDPGETAAVAAAQRWFGEGRRVRIVRPPRGMDFNDLLLREATR